MTLKIILKLKYSFQLTILVINTGISGVRKEVSRPYKELIGVIMTGLLS